MKNKLDFYRSVLDLSKKCYELLKSSTPNKARQMIKEIIDKSDYEEYILYRFYGALNEIIEKNEKFNLDIQYNNYQIYCLMWVQALNINFSELKEYFTTTDIKVIKQVSDEIDKHFIQAALGLKSVSTTIDNKNESIYELVQEVQRVFNELINPSIIDTTPVNPLNLKQKPSVDKNSENTKVDLKEKIINKNPSKKNEETKSTNYTLYDIFSEDLWSK